MREMDPVKGRTLRLIEATELAAVVTHSLTKSCQSIEGKQVLKGVGYLGYTTLGVCLVSEYKAETRGSLTGFVQSWTTL